MRILRPFSFLTLKAKVPQQITSGDWEDREAILQPGVNLFCWQRPINPEIESYLEVLQQSDWPKIQQFVAVNELDENLEDIRKVLPSSQGVGSDAFFKDLRQLTSDFLRYSENGSGTLHLRLVTDNACTKFHIDGYKLRLFTTYAGLGTEWLPESAVNRDGLGRGNGKIVRDIAQVRQMAPFEVGILKGEIPKSQAFTKGIVHRSPQISHLGEKRIILRIDL